MLFFILGSSDSAEKSEALSAWDFIQPILTSPFTWGLVIGLSIAFVLWRSSRKDKAYFKKDIKRVQKENKELQSHLATQLKVTGAGNQVLENELKELKKKNANLQNNISILQQKTGKAEMRRLEVMETAVAVMREQAPGFAPAWEKALREAEEEMQQAEGGFSKIVRRFIPSLSSKTNEMLKISHNPKKD